MSKPRAFWGRQGVGDHMMLKDTFARPERHTLFEPLNFQVRDLINVAWSITTMSDPGEDSGDPALSDWLRIKSVEISGVHAAKQPGKGLGIVASRAIGVITHPRQFDDVLHTSS